MPGGSFPAATSARIRDSSSRTLPLRTARSSSSTSGDVQLTVALVSRQPHGWVGSVYSAAAVTSIRAMPARAVGPSSSARGSTAPCVRW